MKKALWIIIALIVVGAASYFGYTYYQGTRAQAQTPASPQAQQGEAPQSQGDEQLDNIIWASGKLMPAEWANLAFETGGRLMALNVGEGSQVTVGQLLGQVDAPELESAVKQAEAGLTAAQAELAIIKAPARPEEIAPAEAGVQAAQAGLAAAQAALNTAQSQVAVAQAQVAVAQANTNQVQAGSRPEEVAAAAKELELAQAVRDQAQSAYDKVAGQPDVGMLPQSMNLQQATARYEAALASYQAVLRGPTTQELAVAQSQVAAAQSQVGVAETAIAAAQADISRAEAAVAQAQAALDLLKAGPRAEDVAAGEAALAQTQAALDAAQAALAKTELRAPFAGTVGVLWVNLGEVLSPGQQVMTLGNLDHLWVETTDLRETDVARVQIGQEVEVTFDALANQLFKGTVKRMAPMSNTEKGSVNYKAIIEVRELHPALRWGMTAFVNIEAK